MEARSFASFTNTTYIVHIYHLFTETEGNSVFCGPETANNGGRGQQNRDLCQQGRKILIEIAVYLIVLCIIYIHVRICIAPAS